MIILQVNTGNIFSTMSKYSEALRSCAVDRSVGACLNISETGDSFRIRYKNQSNILLTSITELNVGADNSRTYFTENVR